MQVRKFCLSEVVNDALCKLEDRNLDVLDGVESIDLSDIELSLSFYDSIDSFTNDNIVDSSEMVTEFYAEIRCNLLDLDKEESVGMAVGELNGYCFSKETLFDLSDIDLLDLADSISGDVLTVVSVLEENDVEFDNLVVIDKLEIKDEYRCRGFGSLLVSYVFSKFKLGTVFTLVAEPLGIAKSGLTDSDKDDLRGRLVAFYEDLSFINVADNVMATSLER